MNNGTSNKDSKANGSAGPLNSLNPAATLTRPAPETLGVTAIRPKERHGWDAVRHFVYDKESGAYFTRTPKSWALIILFYIVFYACLAGFWFGLLQIFFLTLNDDTPKYLGSDSIIGANPGLGLRPSQVASRTPSTLYIINGDWNGTETNNPDEDNDAGMAARMSDYFAKVNDSSNFHLYESCNETELTEPRKPGQNPCKLDLSRFGECGMFPYGFGMDDLNPCFIVKVNKIFNFVPQLYEDGDEEIESLPDRIKELVMQGGKSRRIFVDCEGETSADKEALKNGTAIKYYPEDQSFPLGFFPHQHRWNKVSPAVAIQFVGIPRGQMIHVVCKVWFKGVVHDSKERSGMTKFDIEIKN